MTLEELNGLYYLDREIAAYRQKIAEIRAKAESTVGGVSAAPGRTGVSDKTGDGVAELAEYEKLLNETIRARAIESARIHAYINSISDPQIRLIMYWRFIQKKSWRTVAFKIGGGNTEDGVKKRIYRFLDIPCPE